MNDSFITGEPLDSEIAAFKQDIDRTLLRENLKLSVEERLLQLIEQARLANEFDKALTSGK